MSSTLFLKPLLIQSTIRKNSKISKPQRCESQEKDLFQLRDMFCFCLNLMDSVFNTLSVIYVLVLNSFGKKLFKIKTG